MRLSALVCLLFIACALAAKLKWTELDHSYTFEAYLGHYNKHYDDPKEYKMRQRIFEDNLDKIIAHNKDSSKTWKEEINHLADWTEEEMKSLFGYNKQWGYSRKEEAVRNTYTPKTTDLSGLPAHVDWREVGVVSPVKDQGQCGSCWSFATAETIESHWALATDQLWVLSEQQILDCTINPDDCGGTGGCSGGTVEVAMTTIIKVDGLASEWTYPYLSWSGTNQPHCLVNNTQPAVNISSYVSLPSNEYEPLLAAVATVGPIAISVDASSWAFYAGGIYNGCNQTNPDLDHAVQLVGYGSEDGNDYWLVRNSWTPAWGENGYIRLARPANNTCGTDTQPGDGDGCNGGPSTVTVCGTCGILYDSVYPLI